MTSLKNMAVRSIYLRIIAVMLVVFCFVTESFEAATTNESDGVCEKPPTAENGTIAKVEVISQTKVAWYKCNPGYQLHGTKFRICRPDRGWSGYVKCKAHPVKMKIKDLAFAMEETEEGRVVTIAVIVTVLVILLLAVHLGRVVATRKSLKTKYEHVLKSGKKPSRQLPTICQVSNDLVKTTLCCQDSELPKSFKPRKEKKKKEKRTEGEIDEFHEKDHFRSDTNTNSPRKLRPSRDNSYFRYSKNTIRQMGMAPLRDRHSCFRIVRPGKRFENERILLKKPGDSENNIKRSFISQGVNHFVDP